ncbi:MAG: carbohydrate ABC transporter permease, partial [Calditrichia bacterium]
MMTSVTTNSFRTNRLAYFYVMPALLVMAFVILWPFLYNVAISVSNMNLTHFRDWKIKGLSNYWAVLTDKTFWWFLWKTVLWTGINLVFHVGIGVFLALILNKDIKGKSIYRTLLILPWAVPQYITALTWRGMFNSEYGAINLFLNQIA